MKRIALLTLASAVLLPSTAFAWQFVCDTFQVVECADGTTIGCSAGGQQIDCPDNAASLAAFDGFCDDYGGIVGVTDESNDWIAEEVYKEDDGMSSTPEAGLEYTPVR